MFRPISNKTKVVCRVILVMLIAGFTMQFKPTGNAVLQIKKDVHIVLIGNNLGSRMMNYGHFETELNLRYPESNLYIRNMCDGGNTQDSVRMPAEYRHGHSRVLKNFRQS